MNTNPRLTKTCSPPGTQAEMKSTSGRLLLLTILMFQVLLMTYYTSGLTAGLALGPPLPSVNTIEDISSNPKLTLGWRKGAAHGETFRVRGLGRRLR